MKNKKFLISIDTEGDNLWSWDRKSVITTENTLYLPRFQSLCNKYGFKPTYLTNYEMVLDERFVSFAKQQQREGNCEIGMHLHAWNNPPEYVLQARLGSETGNPYLIEYPEKVMEDKIATITELLRQTFESDIITHRAGRWAMNDTYFSLLDKYNYKVDCSVTPFISWSQNPGYTECSAGSNYVDYPTKAYIVEPTSILEVPMTVRRDHRRIPDESRSIKRALKLYRRARRGYGRLLLRPNGENLDDLIYLVKQIKNSPKDDYLMFMLHSSEFMPGGSPTFDTEEKIDKLYKDLEVLFKVIGDDFEGMTIGDYYNYSVGGK